MLAAAFSIFSDLAYSRGRTKSATSAIEEVVLDQDEKVRQTKAGKCRECVEAQIGEANALVITVMPTYLYPSLPVHDCVGHPCYAQHGLDLVRAHNVSSGSDTHRHSGRCPL